MVRVPQFTLSPRLWVYVTDVVVTAVSLTRDLGKLRQEGSPEPRPSKERGPACCPRGRA